MMNHDSGNDISRDDYYQGYGLLCLDLTPDACSASESIQSILTKGIKEMCHSRCTANPP